MTIEAQCQSFANLNCGKPNAYGLALLEFSNKGGYYDYKRNSR